jgi:CRISPR-associated endonuclease/helicase Cas3
MKYIAHKRDDGTEQSVKEHLGNTAKLAADFAKKFGCEESGRAEGLNHDLGKYSKGFQNRIQNDGPKVDHATAGAKSLYKQNLFFLAYPVACHHTGLVNSGSKADGSGSSFYARMNKDVEDYSAYKKEISLDINVPKIYEEVGKKQRTMDKKNPTYSVSFLIRMLYSCLVDADYLDTESFMSNETVQRGSKTTLPDLKNKLDDYVHGWLQTNETKTINGRRSEILKKCIETGNSSTQGFFKLTVPTGGGKTISSLAFALHHAVTNHLDRIIYVIPYTSIIEQAAQVFREILGEDVVLEHHTGAEFSEDEKEANYYQLASENWDIPIIVTTNVQFFESFYGKKSSKCRKLHNVSNSVVIFDEAQMIPVNMMTPCLKVIDELVSRYNASVVLCTATQPAIEQLDFVSKEATELCPRVEQQFEFFDRVTYCFDGEINESDLVNRLQNEHQALCIVDTRKRAQEVFDLINGEGVFHLSASMYPEHRKRVLSEIKDRLKKDAKCILISTSVIEAGVDVDFQTVYRQMSGIDSIIQAAGRCNREGKKRKEDCVVHIFEFDDHKNPWSKKIEYEIGRKTVNDPSSLKQLETIKGYYQQLYTLYGDRLDEKKVMDCFVGKHFEFEDANKKFKIIDSDTASLYVFDNDPGMIDEILQMEKLNKLMIRMLSKNVVQLNRYKAQKLFDDGHILKIAGTEDMYVLSDLSLYDANKGFLETEEELMSFIF